MARRDLTFENIRMNPRSQVHLKTRPRKCQTQPNSEPRGSFGLVGLRNAALGRFPGGPGNFPAPHSNDRRVRRGAGTQMRTD